MRQVHLLAHRLRIFRRFRPRREHDDLACAQGNRTQQHVDADARHVPGLERNHARGQAAARRRRARQAIPSVGAVVEQDAGVAAAGVAVGAEQGLHLRAAMRDARELEAHRPGGTYRGTGSAAHAQVRIDPDVVAVGADRLRRTDVDALAAAVDPRARMRAEVLAIGEVARLLEFPDRVGRLVQRKREGRGIGHAPITLRRLVMAEERRVGKVDHQVEDGTGRPRQRAGLGVTDSREIGDHHREASEIALQRGNLARPDGERGSFEIRSGENGGLRGRTRSEQEGDRQGTGKLDRSRARRARRRR